MTETQDTHHELVEAGYPQGAIEALLGASEQQFEEALGEHGPGKNWEDADPGWALWEATRNISKALNDDGTLDWGELGDAQNYLAFAVEAAGEVED